MAPGPRKWGVRVLRSCTKRAERRKRLTRQSSQSTHAATMSDPPARSANVLRIGESVAGPSSTRLRASESFVAPPEIVSAWHRSHRSLHERQRLTPRKPTGVPEVDGRVDVNVPCPRLRMFTQIITSMCSSSRSRRALRDRVSVSLSELWCMVVVGRSRLDRRNAFDASRA